tara:strand:+ start:1418 stop:1690 length:273 start_codon:yes stop_codon:yes gene_type:complete
MDKPTLDALRELNGEGAQTIITSADGTVTGNFYKVLCVTDVDMDEVTIDGQTTTALDGMSAKRFCLITNVTSFKIDAADTGAVAIGFTAP